MSYRFRLAVVAAFVIVIVIVFFAPGLRYVPGVIAVYSPPICGPLKDQIGNPAGDAGPCPSHPVLPPSIEAHWEWTPFWSAAH